MAMTKLSIFLFSIASLIASAGVAFGVYQYVEMKQIENRNAAIQECLNVSTHTMVREDGVTTVEPIETITQKCLSLKQL